MVELDLTLEEKRVLDKGADGWGHSAIAATLGVSMTRVRQAIHEAAVRNDLEENKLLFIYRMQRAGHDWPPPVAQPPRLIVRNDGRGRPSGVLYEVTPQKRYIVRHEFAAAKEQRNVNSSRNGSAPMTPEQNEVLSQKAANGETTAVAHGSKTRPGSRGKRLSDELVRQIHQDYTATSMTIVQTARKYHVSTTRLRSRFDDLDLKVAPPGGSKRRRKAATKAGNKPAVMTGKVPAAAGAVTAVSSERLQARPLMTEPRQAPPQSVIKQGGGNDKTRSCRRHWCHHRNDRPGTAGGRARPGAGFGGSRGEGQFQRPVEYQHQSR